MKEKEGITIVALVITIIILLILAGVSIAALTGNGGLINKTKEAKIAAEIASIKEEIQTDILSEQAENQGNISDEALKRILERYGTIIYEEDGTTLKGITTTKLEHEILIKDIFNGSVLVSDGNSNGNGTDSEIGKITVSTVPNAPDITGFNKSKTYYVLWEEKKDKDGKITSYEIPNTLNSLNEEEPQNWYNYSENVSQWANIKTMGGENECYWVWIPRYAYKVPTRGNAAQTIDVKFLSGRTNIPIGEINAITNITPTPGEWVVHPAFTNTGNGGLGELEGIWVAKFEASCSDATLSTKLNDYGGGNTTDLQVRVKPNVTSWRKIEVNNIFTVCKNLTTSGNSLEGTKLDAHMMKNTEWGAVAYLSSSKYGKTDGKGVAKQVWNNPWAYDNTTYYSNITGRANKNNDSDTFLNGNSSNNYASVTDAYNEGNGPEASTTGNVYGIYDMAGGVWEYLSICLDANATTYNSLKNGNKYTDLYSSYSNTKYGDAVYETSNSSSGTESWNKDTSNFLNDSNPVSNRGGRAANGSAAGIFAFSATTGKVDPVSSFRPCVVSL